MQQTEEWHNYVTYIHQLYSNDEELAQLQKRYENLLILNSRLTQIKIRDHNQHCFHELL